MTAIAKFVFANPIVAILLTLGLGYLFGKVKIKSFTVGATVGTLLVAILISFLLSSYGKFTFDDTMKTLFFSLFTYAIAYEVGPSFLSGLKEAGAKVAILSVFLFIIALGTSIGVFYLFHISAGEAAGIDAGALTQSAVLGTAQDALQSAGVSSIVASKFASNMAIAYALTYVFGTVGVIIFIKNITPAILHVKLNDASMEKAEKIGHDTSHLDHPDANDDSVQTDIAMLALGILVGILLGSIKVKIGGIPLTLGSGGGTLFSGLFFGWLHSKKRNIGDLPKSTRWFLKSFGLNVFIATVGLGAGAEFLSAIKSMGVNVILIGAIISIVPPVLSLIFGRYVLKMHPVDIIGALCGAQTISAALNAIGEEADTGAYTIAFTPAYAIGNILLTIIGPIIVGLLIH